MTAVANPHKTARDENFPVASKVLPARVRAHVMAFYHFARAADDIADAPDMDPATKLARLDQFEEALSRPSDANNTDFDVSVAVRLGQSLAQCTVSAAHAQNLLIAFRRDAANQTCQSWDDLIGYCAVSAAPVGRYLLELMGEDDAATGAASDALCAALQITNHLQDCRADYRQLGRVYVPIDWLAAEGLGPQDLGETATSPALRRVIDRTLDETDRLIVTARTLPGLIANRRLRMQAAASVACAARLAARLRREDPLATQVRLGTIDKIWCAALGIVGGLTP